MDIVNYLRIKNGVPVYPFSLKALRAEHPGTLFPASPSLEFLAGHDIYPVYKGEAPDDYDELVEGAPVFSDGKWYQNLQAQFYSLDTWKNLLKQQNASKKVRQLQAGVAYTFPDGEGIVQTRNPVDIGNILAVVSMAMLLDEQGETGAVLEFRDQDNDSHALTPAQAKTFGLSVGLSVTGIYQTKWAVDAAIDELSTVETARAYDIDSAWEAQ